MNYECLLDDQEDIWATCQIMDPTTSKSHYYVRLETPNGVEHRWIQIERVRKVETGL
jgi:hypothetical protein